MKKGFLVGLICMFLVGCGDDKVTKEYLVGDWRCKDNQYERHNVGANEDLGEPVSSFEDIEKFRMIDNELYQISEDRKNTLINLSKLNSEEDEISDTYKTRTFNTMKAIDNNTFKNIAIIEIKEINNDTNIIDLRTKIETTCTRIK